MAKKVIETWKTKKWYNIYAPELFGSKQIGETISSDEKLLINRVITVGLDELTGDFSQSYSTAKLRIIEVKGNNAYTKFIGHEQSPSFIRTFIRRRKTLIDHVVDVRTSDGADLRLKLLVFTACKVARESEADIRNKMQSELISKASSMTADQLLQEILFKKFAMKLIPIIKKIAPIKRVEFRKTEIKESFTK
jgi:small subunit ribosomal protein S3Ae